MLSGISTCISLSSTNSISNSTFSFILLFSLFSEITSSKYAFNSSSLISANTLSSVTFIPILYSSVLLVFISTQKQFSNEFGHPNTTNFTLSLTLL